MDFSTQVAGRILEFIDDGHIYLVDGVEVPSITQILGLKFGGRYNGVNPAILKRAADAGTAVHKAIEDYCSVGKRSELPEFKNFLFLLEKFKLDVIGSEVPVILFDGDKPIAAGRMDLVVFSDDGVGIADVKRTSVLDKEYLAYQLNLYRIAYRQCVEVNARFLKGIHLKNDVRRMADIPINEVAAMSLVNEWRSKHGGF